MIPQFLSLVGLEGRVDANLPEDQDFERVLLLLGQAIARQHCR